MDKTEHTFNLFLDIVDYCDAGNVDLKVLKEKIRTYNGWYRKLSYREQGQICANWCEERFKNGSK